MSTEADVQPLPVRKGRLLPPDYSHGDLRSFVLVDGSELVAEGALFTDGRVVVCRRGGDLLERYRSLDALVRGWAGQATLMWAYPEAPGPRRFIFRRGADSTGFSGSGVALEGVRFTGGVAVLMWLGEVQSLVEWGSVEEALTVHGHAGDTVLEWLDPE